MLAATTLITPIAFATDYTKTDVRGETYCYPAKHAVKVIEQLSKVKDDKRNIVDVDIMPRFLIYDDGAMPDRYYICLLYTSPSPRDQRGSRMPSSA